MQESKRVKQTKVKHFPWAYYCIKSLFHGNMVIQIISEPMAANFISIFIWIITLKVSSANKDFRLVQECSLLFLYSFLLSEKISIIILLIVTVLSQKRFIKSQKRYIIHLAKPFMCGREGEDSMVPRSSMYELRHRWYVSTNIIWNRNLVGMRYWHGALILGKIAIPRYIMCCIIL